MGNRTKKCCLIPKHVCFCNRPKCICYKHSRSCYRRGSMTPRCSWATRNDSSKITALINPEIYKSSSETENSARPRRSCCNGVKRKFFLGDNNCYCNEEFLAPTLLQRPRNCVILDDRAPKPRIKVASDAVCFKVLHCESKGVPQAPSERLRKLREVCTDNESPRLRYTRDRENYECLRDILCDSDQNRINGEDLMNQARRETCDICKTLKLPGNQIGKDTHADHTNDRKSESSERFSYKNKQYSETSDTNETSDSPQSGSRPSSKSGRRVSMEDGKFPIIFEEEQGRRGSHDSGRAEPLYVASNFTDNTRQGESSKGASQSKTSARGSSTETSQSPSAEGSKETSEESKWVQFRKDHYADTHATKESVPEHVCVHKFELDERLFPVPINSDVYGTSRCIICDAVMPIEKTVFKDQRLEKKTFPNYYKLDLKPRRVNIGADNTKIVLNLSEKDAHLLKDLSFAFQKPQYFNTHALRFQRGAY